MDQDDQFMRLALELGSRGGHKVLPNPRVGCILVRDGEVIAEGWHDHVGGLHAEQMAIADAESRGVPTQGSTAFVTLEPCNHFGRTPPCTEALLWAGIERVVIGSMDPNPTVRGNGADSLEKNGVKVSTGILESECNQQMRPFMHWCQNRRPFVTIKAALDSNGFTDRGIDLEPVRFSSKESLRLVHELRAESMAILVGVNTVLRDDPSLTVRGVEMGPRKQPLRVIIDPSCKVNDSHRVISDRESETLLIHTSEPELQKDHEHVERLVMADSDGEIPISRILDMLGDRGIQTLLVEGGADTWNRFIESGFVDMAHICRSQIELEGARGAFDEGSLKECGLTKIQTFTSGGDDITRWGK